MGFAKVVAIIIILAIILAVYSMSFSLFIGDPANQKLNPACWIANCQDRTKRIVIHSIDVLIILVCVGILIAVSSVPF